MRLMAALAVLLLPGWGAPATSQQSKAAIKTKDGRTIEGEIVGLIVLKRDLAPSSRKFAANYYLVNGSWVESMTEEGVKLNRSQVGVCGASQDTVLDDLDAVATCAAMPDAFPSFPGTMKAGGTVVKLGLSLTSAPAFTDRLLGTFRKDGDQFSLVPALEVSTGTDRITVQVRDVIDVKH